MFKIRQLAPLRVMLCMLVGALVATLYVPAPSPVQAQDGVSPEALAELADELYIEVNRGLLIEGLRPLARNETLDQVAQTIADELGATGSYSSLPRDIANRLNYARWPDGGQRVLRDAINGIGLMTPREFVTQWRTEMADIIRNAFYREAGVAVTTRVAVAGGNTQFVYVVVMGAQPNVLPVVINDGAATAYTQEVELYIHNELSLAYETDANTIQQAHSFRLADSESGLDDADWMPWEKNNFAYSWQLGEEYGDKSVWAEFEDVKGVRVRYEAKVTYADPRTAPTASMPTVTPSPILPVTLRLTYRGDTLTLQVITERRVVRLQDVYFRWFDEQRFYELKNADALQNVNLSEFPATACIQIRSRGTDGTPVTVAGCETIFLEAGEFANPSLVFWNPDFRTFEVFDGPRLLGECRTNTDTCELQLR